MDRLQPLRGRVALVTGASRRSGIGQTIVRRLAGDGAAVLVHSFEQAVVVTAFRLRRDTARTADKRRSRAGQ